MEQPPDLLIANVTTLTTEFVLVLGSYNFAIAKTFGFPVVGLPDGWFADYQYFSPFSTARRIELVISRTLPQSTASQELPLPDDLKRSRATCADYATNTTAVRAISRDAWARKRFRISNHGVLSVAQHRFRAAGAFSREEYRKQFVELPRSDKEVLDFCKPPQQEIVPGAVGAPPKPTVKSQFEFDMMSPEEKANQIHLWQDFWATRATPAAGAPAGGFAPIVVQVQSTESTSDCDWKGTPSASERESMRNDDWKKF